MIRLYVMILMSLMLTIQIALGQSNDPTRPYNYSGGGSDGSRQSMIVSAILVSAKRKMAIINNRPLEIGEKIGDTKVIGIDANSVRFRDKTGVFSVMMIAPIKQKDDIQVVKKDQK